jgi:regulatory protein
MASAERPPPSLKARALQWLAQREHSRDELRRKLLTHARRHEEAMAEQADGQPQAASGEPRPDRATEVDALLDWLQAHHYLSDERFVESRVHAREQRFGNRRIRQELRQHGLELDDARAAALRQTELERARAVWARRFGTVAADAAGRARQARFLAGRGFSAEVIRRVVGHTAVRDDDA